MATIQNALGQNTNLPGNPTTTTQATGNDSTRVATTGFVQAAIIAAALEDYTQTFLLMGA